MGAEYITSASNASLGTKNYTGAVLSMSFTANQEFRKKQKGAKPSEQTNMVYFDFCKLKELLDFELHCYLLRQKLR